MFDIGGPELLLILGIALLVVGPRRIPELGRRLGTALTHLRRAGREMRNTLDREVAIEDVRQEAAGLRESGKDIRRELRELHDAVTGEAPPESTASSPHPSPGTAGSYPPGEDTPAEPSSTDEDRGQAGSGGPGKNLSG